MHRRRFIAVMTTLVLSLSSCAVGPDYRSPASPPVSGYTSNGMVAATAGTPGRSGVAQHVGLSHDLIGPWWTLYHSDILDGMLSRAFQHSPDLVAAQAALTEAKENVYAAEGAYYPAINGASSATRQRESGVALGLPGAGSSIFTLYNASVNVSYTLDVFGGTRRQVESVIAQAEYERFQVEAAYLSLTGNIVTAAIQQASLRDQLTAVQQIQTLENQELATLKRQFAIGGISNAGVLAEQANLAATEALLPPLQLQLAQTGNQLAFLCGQYPSEQRPEPLSLESLTLPDDIPVSLPSQLVNQRPDIRAAAALLHQAAANIGVAVAHELPQFGLSASYGSLALSPRNLFSAGTIIWSLAGSVTQPLFEGGRLLHERRAADAAFAHAVAVYHSTVLAAFRDVANGLRALEYDAQTLKAQAYAEKTAAGSVALAKASFQAGASSFLALTDSQRVYTQAHINLVTAQAARYVDTAALFIALGGGWWNRPDVTAPAQQPTKAPY